MVNYGNGLIYKICCKDPTITDEYIGSTTNKHRRKQQHKCYCNCETSTKYEYLVYQFIRANGGFDNFDLIVIEEYSCESKVQLEMKEREWIERLRPTLNKNIPTRTKQERKEKIKEQSRRCECKEEIKEKRKQYREEHKEELNEYKKIKHICECGGEYTNSHKSQHMKSQKHLKYLEELNL